MPLASSRRAAVAAPSARRRTRPPSRTGLAESGASEKSEHLLCLSDWGADSCTSGSMTAWESGNDEPIADLIEDIFHALDRLECRDAGKKRANRSSISV